jgi:hypothetical protein
MGEISLSQPSIQSTAIRFPRARPMLGKRRMRSMSAMAAARETALPPFTYLSRSAKRNTPSFWENYVLPKIKADFGSLHVFLNDPYPDGPNPYLQAIQGNLSRLQEMEKRQP